MFHTFNYVLLLIDVSRAGGARGARGAGGADRAGGPGPGRRCPAAFFAPGQSPRGQKSDRDRISGNGSLMQRPAVHGQLVASNSQ